jgi:hypothetical protein
MTAKGHVTQVLDINLHDLADRVSRPTVLPGKARASDGRPWNISATRLAAHPELRTT